ncbi:MAG TPA: DNA polymerase III subunit alpha [Pantanalinema sp.]
MPAKFVHCHVHSEYSLLDGASRIGELVKRAAKYEMPALALTDHGVMYGAIEFYRKAKEAGIKPLIGMEAYIAPGSRFDKTPNRSGGKNYGHLVLLAKNRTGYKNLVKLNSLGHLEGFYHKPRIDKDALAAHSEGLIALTACLGGEIPQHIMHGRFEEAEASARWYQQTFGDDFYLEVQNHGLAEQQRVNKALLELSDRTGIKIAGTNDSHYTNPGDQRSHEALLCIQTGKSLLDPTRKMHYGPDFYLKTAQEMAQVFHDMPQALHHTLEIAQKCNLILDFGRSLLPRYDVPQGHDVDTFLTKLAWDGLKERYETLTPDLEERLRFELQIIQQMGFSAYFLIVWDFINFAKTSGIQVGPGRGSAAGSLVAYCLKITNIDPVKYFLLFERFLNPERVSMPDMDIDFCIERRGEVIEYVAQKYGRDKVAQIVTFGTLGAKAAIKDVGRVLELNFNDTNRLTKMVPEELGISLDDASKDGSELFAESQKDPKVAEILELGKKLEGIVRNTSLHAAGVIIARDPLTETVPLQRVGKDDEEGIATQYEYKYCEMMGLLKMDFLGLRNLTMIAKALVNIKARHGVDYDLNSQDFTDPKVYELLQAGGTVGIFQVESEGMTKLVKRLQPTNFEDISAILALYRPGPLQSGYVDEYVDRKHGKKPVEYAHPDLVPILKDTYGTMVFQEQIMQIAQVLAGYSLGQADLLRRAMGKKKKEEMDKQREIFLQGTQTHGVSDEVANDLFDKMTKFSEYCFNRAHTAAYAVVTYHTAYLKAHYPSEYMAALMSSLLGAQDKILLCINDCRRMGIPVLPPDVNSSGADFTPTDEGIRFGLGAIKNVGFGAIDAIVEARSRQPEQRFTDFYQFCSEVDLKQVNKRCIESLIRCGALDTLGGHRAQYLAALDDAVDRASRKQRDAAVGQISLFGGGHEAAVTLESPTMPDVPAFEAEEQLAMEKELIGFYVSGHPLQTVPVKIEWHTSHTISQLPTLGDGKQVVIGGLLMQTRRMITKNGDFMLAGKLEDFTDQIDVVAFPKTYETCSALLHDDAKLLIKGKYSNQDDRQQVIISQVFNLGAMPSLHLHLSEFATPQQLVLISQLLRNHQGEKGAIPVIFHFDHTSQQVVASDSFWVQRTPELEAALGGLLSEDRIEWLDPEPQLSLV